MQIAKTELLQALSIMPEFISLEEIQNLFRRVQQRQPIVAEDTKKPLSCLELAQQHGLVGILKNAPPDLSTNGLNQVSKKHKNR